MKRKHTDIMRGDVIFRPALTPLEAAVLPACDRRDRAALHLLKRTQRERFLAAIEGVGPAQRQKIWVR